MTDKKAEPAIVEEEDLNRIELEDRIDEFSVSIFAAMGFKERLSDSMVTIFKAFKKYKDVLQPGKLTPEGFATIAVLGDMADGKIEFGSPCPDGEPAEE